MPGSRMGTSGQGRSDHGKDHNRFHYNNDTSSPQPCSTTVFRDTLRAESGRTLPQKILEYCGMFRPCMITLIHPATYMVNPQSSAVTSHPSAYAPQKRTPYRMIHKVSGNVDNDGMTHHKVAPTWASMRTVPLSLLQNMPNIKLSGSDATRAPKPGYTRRAVPGHEPVMRPAKSASFAP